jgi:uncharacterized membrane protein HdeD (DUF308 family)
MALAHDELESVATEISRWWWMWLVAGFLWIAIAMVILQFDTASARTVGVIVGIMLFAAGVQYLVVGALAEGWKWLWYVFGAVLIMAGITAMANPARAFVNVADMLGFLFAFVGFIWVVEAFATKEVNLLWWVGLLSGVLMLILAFWMAGQFFFDKAYTLLVFAGIWAMAKGLLDVIRAFQIRSLGRIITSL